MYQSKASYLALFNSILEAQHQIKSLDIYRPEPIELFLHCKNARRRKKSGDDIKVVTLFGYLELELFLCWFNYQSLPLQVHIIFYDEEFHHWFYFCISHEHTTKIFIFEPFFSHRCVPKLVAYFNKSLALAKIFLYGSSIKLKTAIERNYNCVWFALQACYRMSNLDIFSLLERDEAIFLRENNYNQAYRDLCRDSKLHLEHVRLIFPINLPKEMAALFLSCEASETFDLLPNDTQNCIISSKKLSLKQLVEKKHSSVQYTYYQNKFIKPWQATDTKNQNHTILYFKIKELSEIIKWLSIQSDKTLNSLVEQRLNFNRLVKIPTKLAYTSQCNIL